MMDDSHLDNVEGCGCGHAPLDDVCVSVPGEDERPPEVGQQRLGVVGDGVRLDRGVQHDAAHVVTRAQARLPRS